jgi:hypothetical protein
MTREDWAVGAGLWSESLTHRIAVVGLVTNVKMAQQGWRSSSAYKPVPSAYSAAPLDIQL